MKAEHAETADTVSQRLRALRKDNPELGQTALFYESVFPLLSEADLPVTPVYLTSDQAMRKLQSGFPLLYDIELGIDLPAASRLMIRLARVVEEAGVGQGTPISARSIRLSVEKKRLDVGPLLIQAASGDRGAVTSTALDLELDHGLLWALTECVLRPAFNAWRRQLTPLSDGADWQRGECFVCGATPIIGELRDNNLVKHLRCGRCGADWQFRRLQCLYCGNEDHRTLSVLYNDYPHERQRVEACGKCRGYLKVITTFSATPPELLQAEDLATLHLDYAAQKRGYVRRGIYGSKAGPEIAWSTFVHKSFFTASQK